ncbi:hypothetical protein ABIC17_001893 [Sphingomonas sp. PvP056]
MCDALCGLGLISVCAMADETRTAFPKRGEDAKREVFGMLGDGLKLLSTMPSRIGAELIVIGCADRDQ